MNGSMNANLFKIEKHDPLEVNIYFPEITPKPEISNHFYQIIGKLARKLTGDLKTAVISERGQLIVLEDEIQDNYETVISLSHAGDFTVKLTFVKKNLIRFVESPREYGRLISKIVDLALCHFSRDYYKFSENSPYIIERGEGYFDDTLRNLIGIEDGRRFYRGIRLIRNVPHIVINRDIDLRSFDNLLNELKILGDWWNFRKKSPDFDFYNPPQEFIGFINWIFRFRRANVKAYPSRPVRIKEISWDVRAGDNVLDSGISPLEYHKKTHGITLSDSNQPLVIWEITTEDGELKDLYHIPELLVVGHTFKDISMRVSKSRISPVYDIIHPHCGEQLRKIFTIMQTIDSILRENYSSVYPIKVEFQTYPRDINEYVLPKDKLQLIFKNKEIDVEIPYGSSFYRKYSKTTQFINPIEGKINLLIISENNYAEFIDILCKEFEQRNNCEINLLVEKYVENANNYDEYDVVISILDDEKSYNKCKSIFIGKYGIPHQNITTQNANSDSIPQIVMQLTLKLGGYPWLINSKVDVDLLTVYSYRNPLSGNRFYLYNIMKSNGELIFQSKPLKHDNSLEYLDEIEAHIKDYKKLVVLFSHMDDKVKDELIEMVLSLIPETSVIRLVTNENVRLFSTFKPTIIPVRRRRRRGRAITHPIEAYEAAPQGSILKASNHEYYVLTTSSTKVGTYHRGCPTTLRFDILASQGISDHDSIITNFLKLCMASSTSGHGTRVPAPLYYLRKYAQYINQYPLPSNDKIFRSLFYV